MIAVVNTYCCQPANTKFYLSNNPDFTFFIVTKLLRNVNSMNLLLNQYLCRKTLPSVSEQTDNPTQLSLNYTDWVVFNSAVSSVYQLLPFCNLKQLVNNKKKLNKFC